MIWNPYTKTVFTLFVVLCFSANAIAWTLKEAPLMTTWASLVDSNNPLPEYPRPQMVRADWMNLNGIWQFQSGKADDGVPVGKKLSGDILVPFPVESAISGVMQHFDRLWYRRTFTVPIGWSGKQIILNFGAVDWESEVYINGKSIGIHKGGYDPFSYDITPYLDGKGEQEIIVRVYDPTEGGSQPRGKQTTAPVGIMYTPTSGIWQTVWLEPVSSIGIRDLKIVPDVDGSRLKLIVCETGPTNGVTVLVKVKDSGKLIQTFRGLPNHELSVPLANPKLWSPQKPFLYDLDISLIRKRTILDRVTSYFGMRKIALGDDGGIRKIFLNNKFLFEMGTLDQGFWPDGLYTAPTDAALKSDVEQIKACGFNMVRKHVKVEPARWYYWTDKLGLLVWQDMPSANSYLPKGTKPPQINAAQFKLELERMIETHWNSPSIILWVLFNEAQGQHDTEGLVKMISDLDSSRLVNEASGSDHFGFGNILDIHSYPEPACLNSTNQAVVCGEYGGIGYLMAGHTWAKTGRGYTDVSSAADLIDLYRQFTDKVKAFRDDRGLSAAVYTQFSDVETELNGLVTYDRIAKADVSAIAKANHFQLEAPMYYAISPTSEFVSQIWKFTTNSPITSWNENGFDDSTWGEGGGGFGRLVAWAGTPNTKWNTSDIWLRKVFNPGALTSDQISSLVIKDIHSDNVWIYINGRLAYSSKKSITAYEYRGLTQDARNAVMANTNNLLAVHCHGGGGPQYIDIGVCLRACTHK